MIAILSSTLTWTSRSTRRIMANPGPRRITAGNVEEKEGGKSMKKYLFALLVLCLACSLSIGEEKQFKVLFRDYRWNDVDTRPISAGAVLWDNDEHPNHLGIYASVAFLTYKNWRLETGGVTIWDDRRGYPEIDMLTGISVRLWERVVVGAWYAPFWNTYGIHPDDPWGIMVGYAFKIPGL
jgi:hypothetical protein